MISARRPSWGSIDQRRSGREAGWRDQGISRIARLLKGETGLPNFRRITSGTPDVRRCAPEIALSLGVSLVGVTLIGPILVLGRRHAALVGQLHARERELQETNTLLRRQSRTDALTGLANRLRLREDFADLDAQAKRYGQGYCLVLIDLDHFKQYNDDHGHQAGDLVLARVADMINENMRASDRAYRYGGEELLLLLRDQALDAGHALAERHRMKLRGQALPHALNPPHGVVTLSAGVAAARPGETPEQVLHRADQALYQAKALGRHRTAIATPAATPSGPAATSTPA